MAHIRIETEREGIRIDVNGNKHELVALIATAFSHPDNDILRGLFADAIELLVEQEQKSNLN